jgi:hypothetical protein
VNNNTDITASSKYGKVDASVNNNTSVDARSSYPKFPLHFCPPFLKYAHGKMF